MKLAIVPFLICCLLSMSLFEYTLPRESMDRKSIEHFQKRATQQIVDDHAKLMKKKYGMTPNGESQVLMNDKVYQVKVLYEVDKKVTEEEARKIHIDVTESLIAAFNNHKKYKRYMEVYPFTEKNVFVSIGYYSDVNDLCHEKPFLKITYNHNYTTEKDEKFNELLYFYKGDKYASHPSYREKYEESKKIVKGNQ